MCDLGALRVPYKRADGTIDYRCPAEPTAVYVGRKGGRHATAEGRRCLCNGLLATAGLAQRRPHGRVEPALVTSGTDFSTVAVLQRGLPSGVDLYPAEAVLDYLRGVDQGVP